MSNVVHAWKAETDEDQAEWSMCAVEGLHVVEEALADVVCQLQHARLPDEAVEQRTRTQADDDEPSAGDVVEVPDENPVALARAMQQKRHGGAS